MINRILYLKTLLLLATCFFPSAAFAVIYKIIDHNGIIHLTDKPYDPQYNGLKKVKLSNTKKRRSQLRKRHKKTALKYYHKKNRHKYLPTVTYVANQLNLDAKLIDAMIMVESAYNPNALSNKGAAGLMQLMPATAKRFGVKNRMNPRQNILGGSKYMKFLLKKFKNTKLAIAAYNAGEGAILKYGKKIPPYKETRRYVKKVIGIYRTL